MPRRSCSLDSVGLRPRGAAQIIKGNPLRKGMATSAHQAAEPLHLLSAYCLLLTAYCFLPPAFCFLPSDLLREPRPIS
jgi:hypothetical protein